ncbi:MAG: hypothetical protein KAI53_01175 [Candidatus Aenigmarchaeota archaeon]|nr:hypothetical protein [Candidatus Aenigmarchaeota archaeon]
MNLRATVIGLLDIPLKEDKGIKHKFLWEIKQTIQTISVIYVNLENLVEMKSQMALRGNWKEVTRINKMISMRAQN